MKKAGHRTRYREEKINLSNLETLRFAQYCKQVELLQISVLICTYSRLFDLVERSKSSSQKFEIKRT